MASSPPWARPDPTTQSTSTRLRWRIVGVLLLASLLPLGLVGGGSWFVLGRMLTGETLELQRALVTSHAAAIDLYLAERLRALELVARTRPYEQLADPTQLGRILESFATTYPGAFVDLGVIDAAGDHVAYVGPYELFGKSYAAADWFRVVLDRGVYVSDVFTGYRQVPHCIIAVRRQTKERTWILRATMQSDSFYSLVRPAALGRSGDAYVVAADGRYQTPASRGGVLERWEGALPAVHQGVSDSRVIAGGVPMLRVTTWLNDNRWLLVVEQSEEAVMAPVHRATLWGALVVLLATGLVAITTFAATSHLTHLIDAANGERDELSRDLVRSAKLASLGELATGLAHEINNPLAIISVEQTNIADVVAELDPEPGARKMLMESLERCKRQVVRCSGITAKMLQFGRNREPRLRPTAVGPVLEEIAALMGRQAALRNITLDVDVEAGLPPVVLDGNELEQVLINLINNSLQATGGGGRIQLTGHREAEAVVLRVVDTGSGIPPEHLERVFQPFFTTKAVGQGTGLGLSVCYGIVRGWDGDIAVESVPGAGTTMTITVPIETRITPQTEVRS